MRNIRQIAKFRHISSVAGGVPLIENYYDCLGASQWTTGINPDGMAEFTLIAKVSYNLSQAGWLTFFGQDLQGWEASLDTDKKLASYIKTSIPSTMNHSLTAVTPESVQAPIIYAENRDAVGDTWDLHRNGVTIPVARAGTDYQQLEGGKGLIRLGSWNKSQIMYGQMHWIAFYNYNMTNAVVNGIQSYAQLPSAGLVGKWGMNKSSGIWTDDSGNGNHGVLVGTPPSIINL